MYAVIWFNEFKNWLSLENEWQQALPNFQQLSENPLKILGSWIFGKILNTSILIGMILTFWSLDLLLSLQGTCIFDFFHMRLMDFAIMSTILSFVYKYHIHFCFDNILDLDYKKPKIFCLYIKRYQVRCLCKYPTYSTTFTQVLTLL